MRQQYRLFHGGNKYETVFGRCFSDIKLSHCSQTYSDFELTAFPGNFCNILYYGVSKPCVMLCNRHLLSYESFHSPTSLCWWKSVRKLIADRVQSNGLQEKHNYDKKKQKTEQNWFQNKVSYSVVIFSVRHDSQWLITTIYNY